MLRNAETVVHSTLRASDGEVGKVGDLYFDDQTWTVRYFLVRAGNWLSGKRVLITPRRVSGVEEDGKVIEANLTREEVKASPPAESDRPVSECMDLLFSPHHFYPSSYEPEECGEDADVHLRSIEEVGRYTVAATDGDIGHVAGFIVDDTDWVIRYLIVDTRNFWPGKHVLLSPEWIGEVDWNWDRVIVDLSRDAIKESPEFDPDAPVARSYESDLCRFYNREGYWTKEPCPDDEEASAD